MTDHGTRMSSVCVDRIVKINICVDKIDETNISGIREISYQSNVEVDLGEFILLLLKCEYVFEYASTDTMIFLKDDLSISLGIHDLDQRLIFFSV